MDVVNQQHWWFKVEQEHARGLKPRLQPWWNGGKQRGLRRGGIRESHKSGYAQFSVSSPRNRLVITRTHVSKQGGAAWIKHGWYLQRQGAQQEGRQGIGFDAEGNDVSISKTVAAWQRQQDPHLFKIMLGPEHPKEIDLHAFTRTVMQEVSQTIAKPLTWVAIDHHNIAYSHIHVCLRGVSNGQELRFAKDYLWGGGLARQAGEILTRELGWRLTPELEARAQRAVRARHFSEHDRSLFLKLDHNQEVQEHQLSPYEKQRLGQLEKRGLAWRTDNGWGLAHQWKEKMIMENEREFQPHDKQQERKQGRGQEREKQQERQQEKEREQEREEQRRRIRIIDQLEQERGR